MLSFLLVFFGIRSYRDNVAHCDISFGKAFGIGLCITLISCAFYVGTWGVLSHTVLQNFMDTYSASDDRQGAELFCGSSPASGASQNR